MLEVAVMRDDWIVATTIGGSAMMEQQPNVEALDWK